MPIERAVGITESERYLQRLCERTFLSLWSYPGVYKLRRKNQGKEVCDLLVIFENHIIIFSDKDCQFPNSGNLTVDWKRWFEKSIQKSAQQLWGAERWIKNHSDQLFLNNLCTKPFPLYLPDLEIAKFHLIAVAHNSSARCRQKFEGSGSLKIRISIEEASHNIESNSNSPFYIGDLDVNKTFVHILDDVSLDLILKTLDTVSDFVAYLTKKENLFRSGCFISAASELELLAHYHKFINADEERDFLVSYDLDRQKSELILEDNCWREFEQSSERRAKLDEDLISYKWDALIERISHFSLQEELYFTSHSNIAEQEILLRFLARENRFYRRILAQNLCNLVCTVPIDGTITVRYIPPLSSRKVCYVFMVFPHFDWMTYEEYRHQRRENLRLRCRVAKLRFPDVQHVVGIATETSMLGKEGRSEDITHVDVTEWTSEDEKEAKEIDTELNLSQGLKIFHCHDDEYPAEAIH
jgi:hypothetical protein